MTADTDASDAEQGHDHEHPEPEIIHYMEHRIDINECAVEGCGTDARVRIYSRPDDLAEYRCTEHVNDEISRYLPR